MPRRQRTPDHQAQIDAEAPPAKKEKQSMVSRWVCTLNGEEAILIDVYNEMEQFYLENKDQVRYICYNLEKGKKNRLHLHAYIQLYRNQRLNWMKKFWNSHARLEEQQATRNDEAKHYIMKPVIGCDCKHCTKQRGYEQVPFEFKEIGTYSKGVGSRTDLEGMRYEVVENNLNERELLNEGYSKQVIMYPHALHTFKKYADYDKRVLGGIKYTCDDHISPDIYRMCEGLRRLVFKLAKGRSGREKHLYIWGPPSCGKSWFMRQLCRRYRVLLADASATLDNYEDGLYDIIILDEFGPGALKPTEFKKLLCDQAQPINRRYRGVMKSDNLLVVILSNEPLERCYGILNDDKVDRKNTWEAIQDRVVELQFTSEKPLRVWLDPEDIEELERQRIRNAEVDDIFAEFFED